LLDALPAKQSQAIRATRLDGLSTHEAAARKDGRSDVKVSVHRGLKALAARIEAKSGMNTDELINALASEVTPVPRHAVGRRLVIGLVAGGVVTLALIAWLLGFNPQLGTALRHYSFWMKWGYTVSLGICAALATARLARPDGGRPGWLWLMVVPVLSLVAIGLLK
jgi:hypothetical protein